MLKLGAHYFFAFPLIFERYGDQLANDLPPLRGLGAHAGPQPCEQRCVISGQPLTSRALERLTRKSDPKESRWTPVGGRAGRTCRGRGCPTRTPPSCCRGGSTPACRARWRWRPRCRRCTSQCREFAAGEGKRVRSWAKYLVAMRLTCDEPS